jgi:hypothetical protein
MVLATPLATVLLTPAVVVVDCSMMITRTMLTERLMLVAVLIRAMARVVVVAVVINKLQQRARAHCLGYRMEWVWCS